MDLSSVLDVLARHSGNLGLRQTDLYMLLFEENGIDHGLDITQTAKNIFSKGKDQRALAKNIMSDIIFEEGDARLCVRIREKWLSKVGSHEAVYRELCAQIEGDGFLPEEMKWKLVSCCDPSDTGQLAYFITLCIICGNYNTIQKKSGQLGLLKEYGVNLVEFTKASASSYEEQLLWECSKREFLLSCKEGGRFATLDIIKTILPKGYVVEPDFPARYREPDGRISPVMDICKQGRDNISIVGEGGIGKTTFLHQWMRGEFLDGNGKERRYKSGCPVPFFIELNRCPEQMKDWYQEALGKTNFITRYIGQIFENHKALNAVNDETLVMVEKEFQRAPEGGIPRYLLLLDGFNEVKSGEGLSIRAMLSNEISVLDTYPNVRIITTSRETQAAYYAANFKNVQLVGLMDDDIRSYFKQSNVDEVRIGLYMSKKQLVKCLRIPLFLCMFTAEKTTSLIPETPGEILYLFFHRDSCFYNIRKHAKDTRTNLFDDYQTALILDFILPYIGWQFEKNDSFSMNGKGMEMLVCDAVACIQSLFQGIQEIPFKDFGYSAKILLQAASSLYRNGEVISEEIIGCIHGYFGILYQYREDTGDFRERNRYAFIHHHFRDYFSAVWDMQLLFLLPCIDDRKFFQGSGKEGNPCSFQEFLNSHYWQSHKTEFISQILMEHRNRPRMNLSTKNWCLPETVTDEQRVLENAIKYCRDLCAAGFDIHYLLQNILSAILHGRGELSGMDLSSLDFKHCNFFNITCSKRGESETLAADFTGSRIYRENFQPESHQNSVIDFVYHGMQCFTLDMDGCIKCWDVPSGRLEYECYAKDPTGISDFSAEGFLKISPDGKFLAVKQQEPLPDGIHVSVNVYGLVQMGHPCMPFKPSGRHKELNSFSFTGDSKGLLMVCDSQVVYGFSLDGSGIRFCHIYKELMSETHLYADSLESEIYGFTSEYSLYYDWDEEDGFYEEDVDYGEDIDYGDSRDSERENYMEEDGELPVPCQLVKLSAMDGTTEVLYSFTGMPQTLPTVKYVPAAESFLLFNYSTMQIEQFFCRGRRVRAMFGEMTEENNMPPCAIHIHPSHPGEYYFMYPENCYLVDITPSRFSILMKYPIDVINKILSDSGQERGLTFKTFVAPENNRFIVGTDTNVYEWNSEEDILLLKYNTTYYNCTNLVDDPEWERFFLVHMFNGVSVFGGSPVRLVNSYCFSERDYFIGISCFEPRRQILALGFSREDHEKVVLLDMHNGQQFVCFSTADKDESICNMCFDGTGEWLLIATQYRCVEYRVSSGICHLILESSDNERVASANYMGKNIGIALVEDWLDGACHVESRCEVYQRRRVKEKAYYRFVWGYILPELTDDISPYFIPQHGDLGITGAKDESGMQAYWVTYGCFLEKERLGIQEPECYTVEKGRRISLAKPPIALDFLFYRHVHAISKYRNDDKGYSYAYLSKDRKRAIFFKDSCYMLLHEDFRHCTYEELEEGFGKELGGYGGHACWEFAIPWEGSHVIACYENFQLMRLDASTGVEVEQIAYTPGLAVCGCCFSGVDADEELKEELRVNGGLL